MSKSDMADLLGLAYFKAPRGKITLAVRLFAIRYASELRRYKLRELVDMAGITQLEPTIKDGMNLSAYVDINENGQRLLMDLGVRLD